jgi:hypothetical protein
VSEGPYLPSAGCLKRTVNHADVRFAYLALSADVSPMRAAATCRGGWLMVVDM